jgi:hypothetical protein
LNPSAGIASLGYLLGSMQKKKVGIVAGGLDQALRQGMWHVAPRSGIASLYAACTDPWVAWQCDIHTAAVLA